MSERKGKGFWAHCCGSLGESRVGSDDLCSRTRCESPLSKGPGAQPRRL